MVVEVWSVLNRDIHMHSEIKKVMHEKRVCFHVVLKIVNFDQFGDGFNSGDQSRWNDKMFLHKNNMICIAVEVVEYIR